LLAAVSNQPVFVPVPRECPRTHQVRRPGTKEQTGATDENEWTDEQLLLTAEEAARTFNIGRTTLYVLLKDRHLHSVHIGRSCRLTRAELKRFRNRVDAAAAEPARRSRRAMPTGTATRLGCSTSIRVHRTRREIRQSAAGRADRSLQR
jgi:excisionase family DNA binding protein